MAKYSRVYVVLATEGIDDAAVLVSCHCVYCQLASAEIFLETDIRRDIEREAVVASAYAFLGARQSVLFSAVWMKVDRKILTYLPITKAPKFLRTTTYHDPVTFGNRLV